MNRNNKEIINLDDDEDDYKKPIVNQTNNRIVGGGANSTRYNGIAKVSNSRVPLTPMDKNKKRSFLGDVHQKRLLKETNNQEDDEVENNNYSNKTTKSSTSTTSTSSSSLNKPSTLSTSSLIDRGVGKPNNNGQRGTGVDISQSNSMRSQLDSIRRNQHQSYRNEKLSTKKMYTLSDLDEKSKYEKESKMYFASLPSSSSSSAGDKRGKVHTINNIFRDPESIGRKALELTNEFRKKQGKPPCQWHQGIYPIAVEHCKNMSEKKVGFGHDGFKDRVSRFPFHHIKSGENVAMNNSDATVAEVSVDGWIHSKGHRENLLGDFNTCTIGVYQGTDGMWYLTQLFAKSS